MFVSQFWCGVAAASVTFFVALCIIGVAANRKAKRK